jgi:hypothetical protein
MGKWTGQFCKEVQMANEYINNNCWGFGGGNWNVNTMKVSTEVLRKLNIPLLYGSAM